MGLIAKTLPVPFAARNVAPIMTPSSFTSSLSPLASNYLGHSSAYMRNEIVFAAIEMLATSAGEPHIMGMRWQRSSPQIRGEVRNLWAAGVPYYQVPSRLIRNGFIKEVPEHPLVHLLNNPNPFMSRGQLWGTIVMDLKLAGNAYILKARGPLGNTAELWRLRPDRVRIIPSATNYIEGYEYNVGRDKIVYPAADIMHFKTRHPLDEYYGMPPLMVIAGRVAIDDYMKNFLKTFFERGGAGMGGVLTVNKELNQAQRDEIRGLLKSRTAGPANWHETLVLDNTDSTYNQMGLNRGLRDALPKELDAVSEARIAMAFGIPGSILGLLIGYESSSYANKRQDWQVFWDLTMTPLLSDLDDVLNLSIVKDFAGIDEVAFDLSDIRALQEDVDKMQKRERENFLAGGATWPEYREYLGRDPDAGGYVVLPANMQIVSVKTLNGEEPLPLPPALPSGETVVEALRATFTPPTLMLPAAQNVTDEVRHECGRLVARDVEGNPELFCGKCNMKFRPH